MKKEKRALPFNLEAERAILGAMLVSGDVCSEALPELSDSDFYADRHKAIYSAVKDVYAQGLPVDLATVTERLESSNRMYYAGGMVYLNGVIDSVLSTANYRYHLHIVVENGIKRRVAAAADEILSNAVGEGSAEQVLGFAEKNIFDIGKDREYQSLTHVKDSALEAIQKFEGIIQDPKKYRGLATGFGRLDKITKGLLGGQLVVLAARPGCGKTAYAMNIVGHMAKEQPQKKVAVFSLEMSKTELAQRLLALIGQVSMSKLLEGTATKSDFDVVWQADKLLNASNVFIDDSANLRPADILSKSRRLAQRHKGLDLIIVDYLQLMSSEVRRESKQHEVSDISRSMKMIAKELNVPVVLLSQMNRAFETRLGDNRRPQLSDLRDSGAIEQDADIVMFLHHLENVNVPENAKFKVIELVIAKHRNGALDNLHYRFFGEMMRFEEALLQKKKKSDQDNESEYEEAAL